MISDWLAFKADWLAACNRYGVDPASGPTSYTICNLKADQRKQHRQQSGVTSETMNRLNACLLAERERLEHASVQEAELIRQSLHILQDAVAVAQRLLAGTPPHADVPLYDRIEFEEFADLWREVRRELLPELTPRQRAMLPTLPDLLDGIQGAGDGA